MNCDRCGIELDSLNIWRLKPMNTGDLKLVWLCEKCYDYYIKTPVTIKPIFGSDSSVEKVNDTSNQSTKEEK